MKREIFVAIILMFTSFIHPFMRFLKEGGELSIGLGLIGFGD